MTEDSGPGGLSHKLPQRLGRYTLTKRLGIGGMAEVFLAQQDGPAGFQKACVVKKILPHLAVEPKFVDMFQREARVAAMLQHGNIVHIYELGEEDGSFYIAMEYVDGAPLHHLARSSWRDARPLPTELVCCALSDAALGLAAAHEFKDPSGKSLGIIHRDISPDNLMINREGITKILDFGVAKTTQGERTATGELKGKLPFLSPEQIRGDPIDHRVDLYALGVTTYWLLTGKRPFSAPTDLALMHKILQEQPVSPLELNRTVPPALASLVLTMIEKDPADRPQSGTAIADALGDALQGRRSVVAPFVRDVLAGSSFASIEESGPMPGGFLPSTPNTDKLQIVWDRAMAARAAVAAGAIDSAIDVPMPITGFASVPRPRSTAFQNTAPTAAGAQDEEPLVVPGMNQGRAALIGVAAAVVLGVVGLIAISGGDNAPKHVDAGVALSAQDAGSVVAHAFMDAGTVVAKHVADAGSRALDAGVVEAHVTAPVTKPKTDALRDITALAPRTVQWLSEKGKLLGTGATTLHVPASTKRVIAYDTKRGGRATVELTGSTVDYGTLPRGKIQLRANPYADVTLGTESLGTTPFSPVEVVVGTYVVRFRYGTKEETRTVVVKAGATERASVDFGG